MNNIYALQHGHKRNKWIDRWIEKEKKIRHPNDALIIIIMEVSASSSFLAVIIIASVSVHLVEHSAGVVTPNKNRTIFHLYVHRAFTI